MRTKDDLLMLQALPLELKIKLTQRRIRDWVRQFGTDCEDNFLDDDTLEQIMTDFCPNCGARMDGEK